MELGVLALTSFLFVYQSFKNSSKVAGLSHKMEALIEELFKINELKQGYIEKSVHLTVEIIFNFVLLVLIKNGITEETIKDRMFSVENEVIKRISLSRRDITELTGLDISTKTQHLIKPLLKDVQEVLMMDCTEELKAGKFNNIKQKYINLSYEAVKI
jgi:hypothetical protein